MSTKITGVYDRVEKLLRDDPKYRDDDAKLVARVWSEEIRHLGKSSVEISGYDFLCLYAKDWITSADSITRARRKLQEHHPELRGTTYIQRQHLQEDIKTEIRGLN